MTRKLITLAGIACMSFMLLTGCGSTPKQPEAVADTRTEAAVNTEETAVDTEEVGDNAEMAATEALEDGVYLASFDTDSGMFHVNEACDGKGSLTVKDGQMTIHISLVSKKILNLYPGLAEDAQKEGAVLLEPTLDTVTYEDGTEEEVFGFDVPVPALGEEFDLALVGEKGTWYDHKVIVSDPLPGED